MTELITNYKDIFDLSKLGYLVINQKYQIIYKNNTFIKLLISSDSNRLSDYIDKDNFFIFKKNLNDIKNDNTKTNFVLYNIHNNYKYIEFSLSPINTKHNDLYLVSLKNITNEHKDSLIQNCCYEISEAIYESDDLETLYHQIHNSVSKITNTNNFYISLVDWSENKINFPYFIDEKDKKPNSRGFKNCLSEYVITNGEAVLINKENTYEDFITKNNIKVQGKKCKNWLGVPLKLTNGKTIGMIGIQSYSSSNMFTNEDLKLLLLVSKNVDSFWFALLVFQAWINS